MDQHLTYATANLLGEIYWQLDALHTSLPLSIPKQPHKPYHQEYPGQQVADRQTLDPHDVEGNRDD